MAGDQPRLYLSGIGAVSAGALFGVDMAVGGDSAVRSGDGVTAGVCRGEGQQFYLVDDEDLGLEVGFLALADELVGALAVDFTAE